MRSLLSEIAATETQARVNKLHKGMSLSVTRDAVTSNTVTAQSTNAAATSRYQNQDRDGKKKADQESQQSFYKRDGIPSFKANYKRYNLESQSFTASSLQFTRELAASAASRLEETQPLRREAEL
ncbi:hypothetical protein BB561_005170 [Smittium simulii]|uniref:Uncharacterized protein n=1 Tax=Smittium simulii TaxID=133385 RepID=A0A2T9YBP6_9FUNG|nr:hypothetical protein BB561_005170 [Smittium simulii]